MENFHFNYKYLIPTSSYHQIMKTNNISINEEYQYITKNYLPYLYNNFIYLFILFTKLLIQNQGIYKLRKIHTYEESKT